MPTTPAPACKQYGLRWLFGVTALVGVLLVAVPLLHQQIWPSIETKMARVKVGMTLAEVDKIIGDEVALLNGGAHHMDYSYRGGYALTFDANNTLIEITRHPRSQ